MSLARIRGLVAAAFTPMKEDGALNLDRIPDIVEHLIKDKLSAMYVLGSTGEGPLLSGEERKRVAEAYVQSSGGRIPVIVNVGHTSIVEARELAEHSAKIGADAISAMAPFYFKPETVEDLVGSMKEIARGAPQTPFYYYHSPSKTGVDLCMEAFLEQARERIPSLQGIKFSSVMTDQMMACIKACDGRYDILFGSDEHLINGMVCGAEGAVGSTYNYAAPLYRGVVEGIANGDVEKARACQWKALKMIRILTDYPFRHSLKVMMKFVGVDCGPSRRPIPLTTVQQEDQMKRRLDEIGFFDWGRKQ